MVMKNPRKIPLGPMELTHIPNLSHGKSTQFFTDVFLFRVGWFGWIYHDLPMIYLWFTYDLSMIYLWFTYMIYLWFIYDLPIWFIYDLSMIYLYDLSMIYRWHPSETIASEAFLRGSPDPRPKLQEASPSAAPVEASAPLWTVTVGLVPYRW